MSVHLRKLLVPLARGDDLGDPLPHVLHHFPPVPDNVSLELLAVRHLPVQEERLAEEDVRQGRYSFRQSLGYFLFNDI